MSASTRRKPKCSKGTACGFSCISGKYLCSSKVLARDAAALVAKVQTGTRQDKPITVLPSPFKGNIDKYEIDIQLSVPPDKVEVTFSETMLSNRVARSEDTSRPLDVNIYVNGNTDSSKAKVTNEKQGIRVAMAAMRAVIDHVKSLPDGTILSNMPTDTDGRGAARAKLYAKAGFGPQLTEDKNMYAVVKGGKIIPVDKEYIDRHYKVDNNWGL